MILKNTRRNFTSWFEIDNCNLVKKHCLSLDGCGGERLIPLLNSSVMILGNQEECIGALNGMVAMYESKRKVLPMSVDINISDIVAQTIEYVKNHREVLDHWRTITEWSSTQWHGINSEFAGAVSSIGN